MRVLGQRGGVLRLRNLRLLLFGRTISVLGDRMVSVALVFAVLEVGGSVTAVGLVLAAETVPLAAAALIGGVVADRFPRRTVMVAADAMRFATQAAMAILLLTGAAQVCMLALLAAPNGLGTGFFGPASTGLLPEIVRPADLQAANALRNTAQSVGEITGPILAGILVAAFGAGAAIGVDALTYLASGVALAAMRLERQPSLPAASFVSDLRDGWDVFRSRRWVWSFVLYFSLANVMWAAFGTLGPIVSLHEFGGAAGWGVALSAMGVGALAGGAVAARIDPMRPLILVAAIEAVFALPLCLLATGGTLVVLVGATFTSGVALTIGMSTWESTLQRGVPTQSLSRVASYDWFGSFVFYPLGFAVWGPVAAQIGVHTSLWLAFGLLCAMVVALLAVPDTRRYRRVDAPSPAEFELHT